MQFKRSTIFFAALVIAIPALAAGAPEENAINIRENPELSKQVNEYEAAKARLSPGKTAILDQLDKDQVVASEPEFALLGQATMFDACARADPELLETHGRMMQTFKLRKIDEMIASRDVFLKKKDRVDFIEQKLLTAHLNQNRSLQLQLFKSMGEIAAKTITEKGASAETCTKIKADLEAGYKDAYVVPATHGTEGFVSRDSGSGALEACSIRFAHNTPNGFISTALLVFLEKPGQPQFDFSTKIFRNDTVALPVEETWIDLGTVNTRFSAQTTRPGQETMVGGFNDVSLLVPVLSYLRDNGAIVGARAKGWDRTVAFEAQKIDPVKLNEVANCAAMMAPKILEPLKQAGFTITADPRHARGDTPPDPNYKTTQMLDDPLNPGGCMWQMAPAKKGAKEVGGVFITTGHLLDNSPRNYTTTFWVIGNEATADGQRRVTFTDAWFVTRDPKTGEPVDTRAFKPQTVKGQRYEINMPFDSYLPFVSGIQANGLTMTAIADGETIEQTYPAPRAGSYRAYYDCISGLLRDRQKRGKTPG